MDSGLHGEGPAVGLTLLQRMNHFNAMLAFLMLYMAFCAFNFGYDVGVFGGVQAMQSFAREFGEYDPNTKRYALPGWLSSLITAIPFLGKAVGCIFCGWVAERWGRKSAILWLCVVSFVGVLLQASAYSVVQFTIGRVLTFFMTGMAIVVVPIYQAETSPRVLRGMFSSTIQGMIIFGQVVATLVTFGTKDIPDAKGWRIPIALQFVTPTVLLLLLPFIPESPRWLLMRNRREEAANSLRRIRKYDTEKELDIEIEAIVFTNTRVSDGTWSEVFDEQNRIRTGVAVLAMFGQQITGQAFPSQYGVIFYQSQGFASQAFLFNVVSNIISLGAVLFTWMFVDSIGRRPVLLTGGTLMGVSLFILAAVGSLDQGNLNENLRGLMVASLMLFSFFYSLSWAPVSYIVVSEAASLRVKEKTNLLACVISVLTTFVTSFTCPYLINAKYANLGGKVGYIYGSFNIVMVVLTFFFIPELKGRTLEEVDQLFQSGVPLRKFGSVKTKIAQQLYLERTRQSAVDAPQRSSVSSYSS